MFRKSALVSVLCIAMIFFYNSPILVSAAESQQMENGKGEYFNWVEKGSADLSNLQTAAIASIKDFTFEIHSSVTSSPFVIDTTSVTISSLGKVYDSSGNVLSSYDGNKYTVTLELTSFPFTSKTVNFEVGKEGTKTI